MYTLLSRGHAEGVIRRHQGALFSAYVGRAVRVRVARSPAPEPGLLYLGYCAATSLKQTQHRGALLLLLLLLLLRVYVCSVLYGSHAEGVIRRHRGALCSAYVGRAVRVRVARSPAPEPKPRVL